MEMQAVFAPPRSRTAEFSNLLGDRFFDAAGAPQLVVWH